jgi:hypothetical protein
LGEGDERDGARKVEQREPELVEQSEAGEGRGGGELVPEEDVDLSHQGKIRDPENVAPSRTTEATVSPQKQPR